SWLRKSLVPGSIRSIGVLAYGRDHSAEIDVAEIGFYN
ncbi:MAG: NADH ubiquinone oxidoreductase, partial [Porticoccaceae bacterium]|nr:NADH ubiquinone oxidoreductase [Porticoccaceae bacterium]